MTADTTREAAWDGRPQNPERDGWHWLKRISTKSVVAAIWCEKGGGWEDCIAELEDWRYLGPCLLPSEAAALLARAEAAEQERDAARAKALEEAAALCLSHSWLRDIEWWLQASKQEVSTVTAQECAAAIRALAQEPAR